ncbi:MAG: TATA-box-binding protein [Methanosarcinaceae archaeon]|jgi:transcription initiation factor TFIID TATA-box-binding protein|nr:TATA-box-binding protein [Methanosarcinaceae archaeon]NKQ37932.1 TATA-box-binding protein [Methanosarcinales archaeon]
MTKYNLKIENVVASTKLADELDLIKMESEFEGAEYNKKKFPGLVYRVKDPKAAFLIFTSGKIVCTGAKTVDNVYKVIDDLSKKMRGYEITTYDTPDIVIQNIVASADLKAVLNLNAIAVGLGLENVEYEPEQFPGLVYRTNIPKVVVLIFSSGKLVVTGGKSPEDCLNGVEVVKQQLDNMGLL